MGYKRRLRPTARENFIGGEVVHNHYCTQKYLDKNFDNPYILLIGKCLIQVSLQLQFCVIFTRRGTRNVNKTPFIFTIEEPCISEIRGLSSACGFCSRRYSTMVQEETRTLVMRSIETLNQPVINLSLAFIIPPPGLHGVGVALRFV